MKRIYVILLAAATLIVLSACGNVTAPADEIESIPNPVKEATAESILNDLGITFPEIPEAGNVQYFTIDGNPPIAEMRFDLNDHSYNYRIAPSAFGEEDISGMHFEWKNSNDTAVDNCPANISWNEDAEGVLTWFDMAPGLKYSLTLKDKASEAALLDVAENIFAPAQGYETAGLFNPIHEATSESIVNDLGISFPEIPEADNTQYFTIDGEPAIAEMRFDMNGVPYNYRIASSAFGEEEISGMYYEWKNSKDSTVSYCPATVAWNEGAEGVVTWFDIVPGLKYSLSVTANASEEELLNMANKIFVPAQGDAEGDFEVDFSDVLNRISNECFPGTAGSSLVGARFAGEICDLIVQYSPNAERIKSAASKFIESQENSAFSEQFRLVIGSFDQILGDFGADLLDSCGYIPQLEWSDSALLPCIDALKQLP